jgi:glycosyltransferase involved in cell wall biosynthesis
LGWLVEIVSVNKRLSNLWTIIDRTREVETITLNRNTPITIFIPAYNNPEYTRRTLESVLEQNYRPLVVRLIDDCSPISLEPLANWFSSQCDEKIDFKYIRNAENQSVDIFYSIYQDITTDWVLQLHHDDRLLLSDFISQCVRLIETSPNVVVCYGNAISEFSTASMVLDTNPNWRILDGPTFITYMLEKGHTAWSAILYKSSLLRDFSFPSPPFIIDNKTRIQTGLDSDEGFSTFYLLAMRGDVAVTGQLVAERGEPANSYSKSDKWHSVGNSLFYIYFGVFSSSFPGRYANRVRKLARISLLLYGLPKKEGFRLKTMLTAYPKSGTILIDYLIVYVVTLFGLNRHVMQLKILLYRGEYLSFLYNCIATPFVVVGRSTKARRVVPRHLQMLFKKSLSFGNLKNPFA